MTHPAQAEKPARSRAAAPCTGKPNIVIIGGDDLERSNISASSIHVTGYAPLNIDTIAHDVSRSPTTKAIRSARRGTRPSSTGPSGYRAASARSAWPVQTSARAMRPNDCGAARAAGLRDGAPRAAPGTNPACAFVPARDGEARELALLGVAKTHAVKCMGQSRAQPLRGRTARGHRSRARRFFAFSKNWAVALVRSQMARHDERGGGHRSEAAAVQLRCASLH